MDLCNQANESWPEFQHFTADFTGSIGTNVLSMILTVQWNTKARPHDSAHVTFLITWSLHRAVVDKARAGSQLRWNCNAINAQSNDYSVNRTGVSRIVGCFTTNLILISRLWNLRGNKDWAAIVSKIYWCPITRLSDSAWEDDYNKARSYFTVRPKVRARDIELLESSNRYLIVIIISWSCRSI